MSDHTKFPHLTILIIVVNDVKKSVYDELVKKVNAIHVVDASKLVKKLTTTQKLKKLRRKYLTMKNLVLLMILINF